MTPTGSRQTQTEPTAVSSSTTPADKPKTDEAKRLMEQEQDAIENARDGYGDKPLDVSPVGKETFRETSQGGTEPTHVPTRQSDRRP